MKKFLMIAGAVVLALALPWYGARNSVQAMEQLKEPSGMALNLAWWATLLPGYDKVADIPRTRLAVAFHQLHDGAEFGDLAQQQQRGEHLLQRLQPLLRQGPQDALQLQTRQLALATLVRMPAPPAELDAQLASELAPALHATDAAQLSPMLRLQAAEALAMFHAQHQNAAAAQQWRSYAEQAVPASANLKEHTLDNTARTLLPLRIALAGCQPQHAAPALDAAQQALAHGYDIRQLRQQYNASWDRPLLLQAQQADAPAACRTLANEYQRMLTAE